MDWNDVSGGQLLALVDMAISLQAACDDWLISVEFSLLTSA
jgi:hypothetical protein